MEPPTLATLNESLEEFANNLTSEIVTTETPLNPFYFYETEQFTVLWILFFAIVIGNAAVLFALLAHKGRKSRMNFFIMHLALADLSVGLISVLTDIIWRITISWYAGNIACKIIRFLQAIVTYSSTYVLVALSIDRYDAITHPMNFSGGWRRARILIATAWLLSIIFCIPIIILYQERLIEGQWQCWIELAEQWQWQIYISLVALTLFLIPAFIITACYSVIVYTIWSKSKMLTARPKDTKRKEANSVTGEEPDCRRASSRGLIPKAKIKTVKMTFVIVFVFILCWSPYIFFDTLQVFGYVPKTQANIALASFIQSLAWLNSAANPIIYCLFSTHLCRNLRRCPLFGLVTGDRPGISESGLGGGGRYLNSHTDTTSVTEPLTSHLMTTNSISVVAARRSRHLSSVM